jgi:arylsulfatase A-like enzyme
MIVRWPGVVGTGSTCGQLVHQADLMATCAEIVGAKLPSNAGEDSVSILPLLKGVDEPVRESAVSQSMRGLLSVRKGDWKMIFGRGSGGWTKGNDEHPAQLYNLKSDLAETSNLYAEEPKLAQSLTMLMKSIVENGRSTPGAKQKNDVQVKWRRFLKATK